MITRPVGDKERRACPACNFIHFTDPKVGVGVLIFRNDKILLVKRSMMPEKGKWSIPAGFLDQGEDPAATAVREVFEETNLEVAIEGIVNVYFNAPEPGETGASIFILYRGRYISGTLAAGDDAEAAAFFGPAELPALAFASTRQAVRRWLEKRSAC